MTSQLRYHVPALALAGRSAQTSPDAVAALDQFAAERGFTLPASVREWYSLSAGPSILREFSTEDYVYAAHELGRREPTSEDGEWDPVAERRLLPFMTENQGVCRWAVALDGSDDPPVMITFGDLDPDDDWLPMSASFSDLVYTRIWDHASLHGERTIRSTIDTFDPAVWAGLGQRLDERPADADGQRYRFAGSGDDQRVLLLKDFMRQSGQCYLWAADDDLLVDLVATVLATTGLATGFSAHWGAQTLDRIRDRLAA